MRFERQRLSDSEAVSAAAELATTDIRAAADSLLQHQAGLYSVEVAQALVIYLDKLGDAGPLEQQLRMLHESDPTDASALFQYARILWLRDPNAAEMFLSAAYQACPRRLNRSAQRAFFLRDTQGFVKAVDFLESEIASGMHEARLMSLLIAFSIVGFDEPPKAAEARIQQACRHVFRQYPASKMPLSGNRRLTIGYVSHGLWQHPMANFLEPLLRCHDRKRFFVCVFASVKTPDSVTEALRELADVWYDIADLPHADLARLIRDEGVDILVDADHHTGASRLSVFAMRAAPVQISAYGLHTPTGIDNIDYRLTDSFINPPGETDEANEALIRLDPCHFAFNELIPIPPLIYKTAPWQRNGYVTFGSANNFNKLTPSLFEFWASILHRYPGSRLIIAGSESYFAETRHRRTLEGAGIDGTRVEFVRFEHSMSKYRETIRRMDLALDSFPYSGGVTTALTLSLGVPVLTMLGRSSSSRVSGSILSMLGYHELIAANKDDYLVKLDALVGDQQRLATLRAEIPNRIAETEFSEGKEVCRKWESLILDVVQTRRDLEKAKTG